ncbi:M6 family metalloprotease domain-containing protein [Vibrio rotiferianus]|uniref:M6 family metalloprotease domain-containing protein n=1 Tax=Vibrio rotiferianus TaxID=190895 RepID=UPI002490BD08|nr:M6 family metalloprotease domain-containing protein [Vibrio rotiferianus]
MKIKTIALSVISMLTASTVLATTPPAPIWHTVQLDDGSESEVILRGSADFHWYEDKQGNALVKQDKDWFFAKITQDGNIPKLESTGVKKLSNQAAPSVSLERPDLLYKAPLESMQAISPKARHNLLKQTSGIQAMSASSNFEQPLLVVQVSFTDQKMDHDFHSLVFGQSGQSVVDFYQKNSDGKYHVIPARENGGTANDGIINVSVNQKQPDCHTSTDFNCSTKLDSVIAEAYGHIEDSVDFAAYDRNGDGQLDPDELSVMFVFAGGDRSTGYFGRPSIWPHKGSHSTVKVDGKNIMEYCVFGDYQTTHQSTMGVIVHELGHLMLGLPDLYSYHHDGSIGMWGVMAGGSWGRKPGDSYAGETPVNMSAWSKHAAGFTNPSVSLDANTNIVVPNGESSVVYLDSYLKEMGPRLYVENRTLTDYDRALEGEGVLVTSVNIRNAFNDVGEMQVQIMQADGLKELEQGSFADENDLYPQGNTSIGDNTNPSLSAIAGFDTNVSVTGITSTSSSASFVMSRPDEPNKFAWLNNLNRGYIFATQDNAIALKMNLANPTELDGLQLFAVPTSKGVAVSYKVWRYSSVNEVFSTMTFDDANAELLQQGSVQPPNRVLFSQPTKLAAGEHVLLVEIEGGTYEGSMNFGALHSDILQSERPLWVGKSADKSTEGLINTAFSTIPFVALMDLDVASVVTAKPDAFETAKNTDYSLSLMANDDIAQGYLFNVVIAEHPTHGSVQGDVYSPKKNFVGEDRFKYRLVSSDGSITSNTVEVVVTVTGDNDEPLADASADTGDLENSGKVTLSAAGSSDPDGDDLEYLWEQIDGLATTIENANTAEASFAIPQGSKQGDVLTFQLTVTDPSGLTSTSQVSVEVQNASPEANTDSVTVTAGDDVVIDVLANDTDADGHDLTIQSVTITSGGGSAVIENGKIRYSAPSGTGQSVTLTYSIMDEKGSTATAVVNINVLSQSSGVSFGDSGGSTSFWALALLGLLGWRRRS